MIEKWLPVFGYEGLYEVSSLGNVRNRFGKTVRNQTSTSGYYIVQLWRNGKPKTESVHRLVASAFIRPPINEEQVDHLDFCKTNNNVENLEWVSRLENVYRAKIAKRQENSYNPKKGKFGKQARDHKIIYLTSPEGVRTKIEGITAFRRKYNINAGHLWCLMNHKCNSAKGWSRSDG